MNPYPNLNLNLNLNLNPNLNLNLNLNPNTNMAILMEDIRNYKKSKDDLYEYCENNGYTHEKMKSAIIYYMNDYSPCLYGISKNNYKEINRYLGCLTTDERNLFLRDIMK